MYVGIKALRSANNLTQEQVADQIGISRQKYARIESGVNSITLDILSKVAEVLGVTINGRSTDEKEQEANYFAACLLMPSDDIDRFIDLEIQNFQECGLSAMDIARIMSEFNVSFDMALNRLESLGVINTDQKMRLDNIKTEMKVGNLLRAVGGNSKLNEPSEVIDIPYEYIDYVIYNYNHNAVPKETLERVLAYYKLVIDDVSDKIVESSDDDDDLDDFNIEMR